MLPLVPALARARSLSLSLSRSLARSLALSLCLCLALALALPFSLSLSLSALSVSFSLSRSRVQRVLSMVAERDGTVSVRTLSVCHPHRKEPWLVECQIPPCVYVVLQTGKKATKNQHLVTDFTPGKLRFRGSDYYRLQVYLG